jgi:hypothetical protein
MTDDDKEDAALLWELIEMLAEDLAEAELMVMLVEELAEAEEMEMLAEDFAELELMEMQETPGVVQALPSPVPGTAVQIWVFRGQIVWPPTGQSKGQRELFVPVPAMTMQP